MKQIRVMHPDVIEPEPQSWSNCKKVGDHVYIAGMVALIGDKQLAGIGDTYTQARVIFGHIKNLMEAAGGCIDDVVRLVIYITDIEQRYEVWRARREYFHGHYPTCALVEVSALFVPEILVEIEAIGIIGSADLSTDA